MAGWTNLTPSAAALAAGNAYLYEDAGALKYQGTSGSSTIVGADGALQGRSFTYTQNTPATIWTVTHNLGYYPQVSIIEFGGATLEGDVAYTNVNTLTVTFTSLASGTAYVS